MEILTKFGDQVKTHVIEMVNFKQSIIITENNKDRLEDKEWIKNQVGKYILDMIYPYFSIYFRDAYYSEIELICEYEFPTEKKIVQLEEYYNKKLLEEVKYRRSITEDYKTQLEEFKNMSIFKFFIFKLKTWWN